MKMRTSTLIMKCSKHNTRIASIHVYVHVGEKFMSLILQTITTFNIYNQLIKYKFG